jgi:long-chain acyl-CoA synthetase
MANTELQWAWPKADAHRDWSQPVGNDPHTLYEILMQSVERFSDHPCFGWIQEAGMERVSLSYLEFSSLVDSVARGFVSKGLIGEERIALITENCVEWAASAYAANRLGAAYTGMYTHQHGSDWKFIIDDSSPTIIIVANTDVLDRLIANLSDKAEDWPSGGVILLGEGEANELPPEGVEVENWSSFISASRTAPALEKPRSDHKCLASLIYTSGTTGNPKGVMLSNWNLVSNVIAVQSVFEIYVGDRNAAFLPWAHSFGSTFDLHYMLRSGVHINLISDLKRIADEFHDRVNAQFQTSGVKRFMSGQANMYSTKRIRKSGIDCDAVPAKGFSDKLFDKLVWKKVRARFGGNLRFALSGAAALSPDIAGFIQKVGFAIYEGYGLTETSPLVSANGWMGKGKSRLHTVGQPISGVKIKIDTSVWDDPDSPDDGEIIVYGPNVMQGYWNNPKATADVMTDDGGFRTGDLGRLSDDGYLSITGRVKSQFKLENGKYVSPAPLEENLKLSPLVEQCVLDGRNRKHTYLIIHPNKEAMEPALKASGLILSGDWAEICADAAVRSWLLDELRENCMEKPTWKGFEKPDAIILDAEEWSTDNDLLTPSLKVKLRNLMSRHEEAVNSLN